MCKYDTSHMLQHAELCRTWMCLNAKLSKYPLYNLMIFVVSTSTILVNTKCIPPSVSTNKTHI